MEGRWTFAADGAAAAAIVLLCALIALGDWGVGVAESSLRMAGGGKRHFG